jgi:hypothetical protein
MQILFSHLFVWVLTYFFCIFILHKCVENVNFALFSRLSYKIWPSLTCIQIVIRCAPCNGHRLHSVWDVHSTDSLSAIHCVQSTPIHPPIPYTHHVDGPIYEKCICVADRK